MVKILNLHILGGGGLKNEYFGGMITVWIFVWGDHKTGLVLEVISMHFRVFT